MRILRVLVPLALFSAYAGAQSAPARGLRMQSAPVQIQPASHVPDFRLSPVTPQAGLVGRSLPAISLAQSNLSQVVLRPESADENEVCYAIRSYDFARESPNSDATRLTGSSTCRSSSRLKLKAAVRLKVVR
ncbi:MAG TPA: hypothetical protein VIJ79_13880 [Acidobacteriaceae bacterium]